jgi:hypothetical protein
MQPLSTSECSFQIFDRQMARLHCLRIDPATYCNEPDGPSYLYERWLGGYHDKADHLADHEQCWNQRTKTNLKSCKTELR